MSKSTSDEVKAWIILAVIVIVSGILDGASL